MVYTKDMVELAKKYVEEQNVPSELFEGTHDLVAKMMSHECYNNPE